MAFTENIDYFLCCPDEGSEHSMKGNQNIRHSDWICDIAEKKTTVMNTYILNNYECKLDNYSVFWCFVVDD